MTSLHPTEGAGSDDAATQHRQLLQDIKRLLEQLDALRREIDEMEGLRQEESSLRRMFLGGRLLQGIVCAFAAALTLFALSAAITRKVFEPADLKALIGFLSSAVAFGGLETWIRSLKRDRRENHQDRRKQS